MADMLATTTQLIIRLNYPDNQQPTDRAQLAIEHATARIQAATRQRLVAATNETVTLPSNGGTVWLPERPVTAVGAVTTTDQYGTTTARVLNTDYYVLGAQIRWLTNFDVVKVTVTYSHGYATVPKDLEDECLRIAALLYENQQELAIQSVGDVSLTWPRDLPAVSPHIITAYSLLAVA